MAFLNNNKAYMIYSAQNLNDNLNKAFQKVNSSRKTVLLKYTINIKENVNIIKSNLLYANNMIYFNPPANKETYIGSGKTIKTDNLENPVIKQHNIISNSKNSDIMTFGINAFDLKHKTKKPWHQIPKQYFIVPKILLSIKNKNTLDFNIIVNKNSTKDEIKDYINDSLNKLSKKRTAKKNNIKLSNQENLPNKKNYLKIFNKTIATIKNQTIEKIVLSKIEKHSIMGELDLNKVTSTMESSYKDCFNFIIKLNNQDFFLGSTPELIVEIKKRNISSIALAGTSIEKKGLDKPKEIKEHSYVIKHIRTILKKYTSKIAQSKTTKLKLKYAYHLQTSFSGKLEQNIHIIEVLKNLYPTPALSGYPKDKALNIINKLEPFDRGFYGGAIGMYNNKGEGHFFASIRSALIRNDEIYFFSGGGITKDSEYKKEWEETETKLKHIKSIINLK